MQKIQKIYTGFLALLIVGGLNWGLIGITTLTGERFDLVEFLFTKLITMPTLVPIVYVLVGLAALVVAGMMCMSCPPKKKVRQGGEV